MDYDQGFQPIQEMGYLHLRLSGLDAYLLHSRRHHQNPHLHANLEILERRTARILHGQECHNHGRCRRQRR